MKKLIYHLLMAFAISANSSKAQTNTIKETRDEIMVAHEAEKPAVVNPDHPIKFRLSTMAGVNFSSAGNYISGAVNSGYDQTIKKKLLAIKPCIDYYFTPRIGAGISYNNFNYELHAESYVGSVYDAGGWFSSPGYIDYYDHIDIKTSGNTFSAHATYKLIQYDRDKRQLFEITARGGISVSSVREEQSLTVTQRKEHANDYYYFEERNAGYHFNKVAGGVILNLQIALHVTRYFSFILADFTQNFGIINPMIPETSVTNYDGRTVTAQSHRTSASGFTLATGLSVSF